MDKDQCFQYYGNRHVPDPPPCLEPKCAVLGPQASVLPTGLPHSFDQDLISFHESKKWSLYVKDVLVVLDTDEFDLHGQCHQR